MSDENECGTAESKPSEVEVCEALADATGHVVLDPLIGLYGLIIAMAALLRAIKKATE